jgi:hypothetical protein
MVVKSVKNSFIVAMAIFNNEGYIASNYDMANHCGNKLSCPIDKARTSAVSVCMLD